MNPQIPDAATLYAGAYTLSRMQPRQLAGVAERTTRDLVVPRLPIDADGRYERRVPADPAASLGPVAGNATALRTALRPETRNRFRSRASDAARGNPRFLGRTVDVIGDDGVRWSHATYDHLPLLWPLKLYAFEPIAWLVRAADPGTAPDLQDRFDAWIDDWIDDVAIGEPRYLRRHWTPWAVSLRIQRFCRYLAWRQQPSWDGRQAEVDPGFDHAFRRELYKNARFLRNHVERDVGGNHLVENGAALLMAGVVFRHEDHDWVETGASILAEVADRQFLDDGCHFERSPMYHVLVLTRFLTACDLLDRAGLPVPDRLAATTAAATAYLRAIRPPDGRIPLLNDSVYDVALPLEDCLRYAEAVGGAPTGTDGGRVAGAVTAASDLGQSGYRWLRTDAGAMLVDGGPVGPPHLPAHAHSDTLQVLLWVGEQPLVVDTGTFEYVAGPRREYARGARGHNTVQVGDVEPITIAGKYLMGPRPNPTTRTRQGTISLFEGRYDARPFGGPRYTHHRAVYAGTDWWLVTDTVSGDVDEPVRARYHLHPDVDSSVDRDGVRLAVDGDTQLRLVPVVGQLQQDCSEYYPRFGEVVERPRLTLTADSNRPVRLAALFAPDRVHEPTLEVGPGGVEPRRLVLSAADHRLPKLTVRPTLADASLEP